MTPRAGYSLMEVLVAFAVMSLTLAVLLPGQVQLLGRVDTASERALAHEYALSRLEEARVLGRGSLTDERYRDWQISWQVTDGARTDALSVIVTSAKGRALARITLTEGIAHVE